MRRFLEGVGIGTLIIAALLFTLLFASCASTGQLIGAGCVTTLCGEICCPSDGKVCPICWNEEGTE